MGLFYCSACKKLVCDAVEVGEEPDYESQTATLCHDCLREAVSLIAVDVPGIYRMGLTTEQISGDRVLVKPPMPPRR